MGHALGPRRVLVVARWYPSYDDPGRGSFVADHVRTLADAGIGVTVASFEPAMLRGEPATRPAIGRLATERWRAAVARQEALNAPGDDGPSGVGSVRIARLPVVLEPGERPAEVEVDAHADPLLAFGAALAAREGIDLVHAHTAVPDGLAAARLADALGVPLVVTEHASLVREQLTDPATAAMVATLAGPGRRLTAVSDHLARLIEARAGLAAGSVGVIPNVVPAALFAPAAAPQGPPGEPGPTTLLWVGARKASKGTDTLLRAFASVRRERPGLRLRLVGRAPTDEEEQRLRALASDLGVAAAVAFDPPVPRASVAQAMRGATLLVHPSPFETFGMVVAEALLVGLPVAATPSGVEAILGTDGACGEVAASCEPEDLAAAVLRALDRVGGYDPAIMRDRVLRRCGPEGVLAATLDAYAAAAAGAPPGPAGSATGPATEATIGPTGDAASAVAAVPLPRESRAIVVCLNRTVALRAIPRLPAAALGDAVIVTGPPTRQAPDAAPAAGSWRELDPAGEYRDRMAELTTQAGTGMGGRLRALTTASARHRERDAMAADRDGWIAAAGDRALEAIRTEAGGGDAGAGGADAGTGGGAGDARAVVVVAVEAADVTAALPLLDRGVPLAPGGLRWLADRAASRGDG